ncbi:MAG: Glu-tRNA(Gln) amidotransferase subunit GatD [Nitrososphaerota archaeon]
MTESWHGYRGMVRDLLINAGIDVGDEVEVVKPDGEVYRGYLMSRYEYAEDGYIVLKLKNGYNVGIAITENTQVRRLGPGPRPAFRRPEPPSLDPSLPHVSIISTGGTIASRVDYRTGAVKPALTSEDLITLVPEIAEIAYVEAEVLLSKFSENMTPIDWDTIARKIDEKIRGGFSGVVISHGTDTLHYTAAALSFALSGTPIPVVLVGAQRSSDRPSSDAAVNLIAAVRLAAQAPFGEVVVAMHDWHSDDVIAVHRGTRVVKMHTSSRDAFRSVNSSPIAYVRNGEIIINDQNINRRGGDGYLFRPGFSDRAALIKFYPSLGPEIVEYFLDRGFRGIIIEGTGLGHVSSDWIPVLKRARSMGVFLGMTSQCRYGRVNMYVYDNGRDIMRAGVTPLEDMLSETALVKLMWVLARTSEPDEVRRYMLTPVAGELSSRTMPTSRRPDAA